MPVIAYVVKVEKRGGSWWLVVDAFHAGKSEIGPFDSQAAAVRAEKDFSEIMAGLKGKGAN